MLETKATETITVVVINVNNEKYLFEVNQVKEIYIPGEKIVPIPLADRSIVGIIDIRGEIYTIISLRHKIRNNNDDVYNLTEFSRILLLEIQGFKLAVLVDSVIGVRELPFSIFNTQNTIVETNMDYKFIRAIGVFQEDTYILINLRALVQPYIKSLERMDVEQEKPQEEFVRPTISQPAAPTKIFSDTFDSPIETIQIRTSLPKARKHRFIEDDINLSGDQRDMLKEIGNIGSGNAVTALSRLIKKKIDVNLTDVGLISYDQLAHQFGGPKEKVCGIFCHIEKPSHSTILQVFDLKPLMSLTADLTKGKSKINPGKINSINDLDDYASSTVIEIGNILAGHYASALADLTGMKMMIDIPELAMSEAGLLGEFLSKELKSIAKFVIIIKTSINIVDLKMNGVFFFIPDIETLDKLFKKLGIDHLNIQNDQGLSSKSQAKVLKDIKLTEVQRDALQEVGNIGAGNAANALAQMINKRVDIDIPSVEMVELDKFAKKINKNNANLLVAWSNVIGKTRATILSMFNIPDIINLTSIIVNDEKKKMVDLRKKITKVDDFPELYRDAMKELGHILGSHYATALGDLLELRMMTEPPDMSIDNGKQLFNILKDEIGLLKKLSLVITTSVIITDFKITGTFLFIPDTETLHELLNALSRFYD
jgi:chemotaxis protein CheC